MGAPAASRLRVAALLALRPALRPFALTLTCSGRAARPSALPGRPCGRRPAASGRRGPLRLRSKAPCGSPSLRLRSRCARAAGHPANGSGDVAVSPDAAAGRRGDARKLLRVAFPLAAPLPRQRYPSPCCGYARIDFVRTKSPGPRRRAALAGQSLSRLPVCRMRYNRMRGRFAAWAAPTV